MINVVDLVVGLGETGRPLYNILSEKSETVGIDPFKGNIGSIEGSPVEYMNICIPYSPDFVENVKSYQNKYRPLLTIIHSTVPIGTTSKIANAVHSPILGKHGNMEESIRNFDKWIGGDLADEAAAYFQNAGMKTRTCDKSEETEALKLLCLAKYGMSVVFADYCQGVADAVGFNYSDIIDWDFNYNNHVAEHLRRPILNPPKGVIGGHCVRQNAPHLDSFLSHPFIKEILKYRMDQ